MSDTVPIPASGDGRDKGAPDGVNTPGRTTGGDSQGGAYQNPHTGKDGDSDSSGFMGHGGQTEIGYHGSGQAGDQGREAPNAATRTASKTEPSGTQDVEAAQPDSPPEARSHDAQLGTHRVTIVEDSGVAAAEVTGKVGSEGQQEKTPEKPGSG